MPDNQRAGMFDEEEPPSQPAKKLNLSGFSPKKASAPEPQNTQAVVEAAEKANFVSREPVRKPAKTDRRHRTGRNRTLAAKVTERTEKLLYEIYDAHKDKESWTLGEIVGMGLEALQRELKSREA